MTVSFDVQTYYPAFRKDRVNEDGYPKMPSDGMTDSNGHTIKGGFSDYFNPPYDYIGGLNINKQNNKFNDNGLYPNGIDPLADGKSQFPSPKKTRWFNNILKAREKSGAPINNPNNKNPNKSGKKD
jgi:hypothetical protein